MTDHDNTTDPDHATETIRGTDTDAATEAEVSHDGPANTDEPTAEAEVGVDRPPSRDEPIPVRTDGGSDPGTDAPEEDAATDGAGSNDAVDADALLVASLEESAGKTAITLALAGLARDEGDDVGYMKPKGTRLTSNVGKTLDDDPLLARELLDLAAEVEDLEPVVYSPTFVEGAIRGREDEDALRERVLEAYASLAEGRDLMLVEGGGRLELGGVVNLTDADVADLTDARVVLVANYADPTDVDDVLDAARAIGERFDGVVFNGVSDAAFDTLEADVIPFLEGRGVSVHGVLPNERSLSGVTVADLVEELGAEVLVEGDQNAYVERFSVGAMGADSALRNFRRTRNAAVVTGGDRAEIHTAALEAPGIKALVLTGGHRPSGAILGQAADEGLPVLAVRTDTLTTVERAEDVIQGGRVRDGATVDRMRELLSDHADVETLLGGL